jgi:hypothetical protein
MLLERLVLHENKRVVLFAPKSVKDSVWVPELKKHLPHIGGVDESADFSNLSVFSHTDLTRALEYPERFERITELADAVVIDEAHHFRNTGKRGDPEDPFTRSRYYKLFDLIGEARHKSVFMLTATPINNSLNDFKHLVELFSRGEDAYFSRTLGVTSLTGRLNSITKTLKKQLGDEVPEAEAAEEAADLLSGDDLFQGLVVQRSRAYARASQIQETGNAAAFPEREDPKVAEYSIRKSYGKLLTWSTRRSSPSRCSRCRCTTAAYYTGPDTRSTRWSGTARPRWWSHPPTSSSGSRARSTRSSCRATGYCASCSPSSTSTASRRQSASATSDGSTSTRRCSPKLVFGS